jgi:P-type Cu+ transporter
MTKDPVCGMNIDEQKTKEQTEYKGQKYSFCSEGCRQEFEANPERYTSAAA